jgi:RNA polymerase sigma factor (sigma-70 family)
VPEERRGDLRHLPVKRAGAGSALTHFAPSRNLGSVAGDAPDLAELARRSVAGDAKATRGLLIAVGPPMFRAAAKVLARHSAETEDVVQEAMEALVEALPGFRGECTVTHFACRVAVLTALANRRRLDLRAQWSAELSHTESPAAPDPSPVDDLLLQGRRQALGVLLDDLPANQAEVIVLHAMLGFTMEEVAAAVGRPLETVRSRLRLAKRGLRETILASPGLTELLKVGS